MEVFDRDGDAKAVSAVLDSGELPPRPTLPLKNHGKSGNTLLEYHRNRGYNLVLAPEVAYVSHASDAIPDGTKCVVVKCNLDTLAVPESVECIVVESGAELRTAPRVKCLVSRGIILSVSKDTEELIAGHAKRELIEGMSKLRSLIVDSDIEQWVPPQLLKISCVAVDKASFAASNVVEAHLTSLDGVTLPSSIRVLHLKKYNGEPLPENLEGLAIEEFCDDGYVPPLPPALLSLSLAGVDAGTVSIPDTVVNLELRACTGMVSYPPFLQNLVAQDMSNVERVPPSVREATFCNCKDSRGVFRIAESLEKLTIKSCDETFARAPRSVKTLEIDSSPIIYPLGLVSLTCPAPIDLVPAEMLLRMFCLEHLDVRGSKMHGKLSSLAVCSLLKRLTFC